MPDCYRALAAAIILCAIKDIQDGNRYESDALEFLTSPAALWLCERLAIHPEVVKTFLAALSEPGTWSPTGTWLSVNEAARAGGYHPNALRRKLREGVVPGATKVGKTWLIPPSSIPVIQRLREQRYG